MPCFFVKFSCFFGGQLGFIGSSVAPCGTVANISENIFIFWVSNRVDLLTETLDGWPSIMGFVGCFDFPHDN
jgi:hypothetical protein